MLQTLFNTNDYSALNGGTDIEKTISNTHNIKSILVQNITPYFFNITDDGGQIVATVPPLTVCIAPIHPGSISGSDTLTATSVYSLGKVTTTITYTQYKFQYALSQVEQPFSFSSLSLATATTSNSVEVTNTPSVTFNGVAQPVTFGEPVPMYETGQAAWEGNVANIVTTNSAQALPANACREVTVIAKKGNTGAVYVGNSNVSASAYGAELDPKDSVTIKVQNTDLIYIYGASGDGVSYVAI